MPQLSEQPAPVEAAEDRLMEAGLVNDVEFLVARARSLGSTQANIGLRPFDLKVRSYSVLALACSDLGPSQRELADFLLLDPSQIVALVDQLQDRNLVVREPDPRDRRSKIITATAAGRKLQAQAAEGVRVAQGRSLAVLSETEQDLLRSLLQRVAFESQ